VAADRKNRLVGEIHDRALAERASQYFHGRLIDIGCGTKPYKEMLAGVVSEHVGVDHADSLHGTQAVDLIGTAYSIPSDEGEFDSALCTAVLEHLEEPEQAIRECYRVLRPGAVAIYSTPFIWHLHEEPRDFYRYSKHGLNYLFQQAGFEVIEIKPLSGFWTTFGQLFVYYIYRRNYGLLRRLRVIELVGLLVQRVAGALDRMDRAEEWTWAYMVVVRKPG
jgi:SAM-dependent methyltransferase